MPRLSGLLKTMRHSHSYSQRGLAQKLGCTQAMVSCWESGRSTPNLRYFARMIRAYRMTGTTVAKLLDSLDA
jgi:transcriptional regulator with XRE-family HTH domain